MSRQGRPPVPSRKRGQGFAALTPEQRTEMGRRGGLASQAGKGAAQRWTKAQAREAGRKGGQARGKAGGRA